ncbi:MAG: DUF4926 domain-containing protein [Clostridiales bacterium]|jgi:hypothetical protein|nr:DUF4926 domain-containing protein [Clostridiales bacterium]
MLQKIRVKTGKIGNIIEIFNDGEAYLVDFKTDDGEYEQETIYPKDIKSIVVEVERPYTIA